MNIIEVIQKSPISPVRLKSEIRLNNHEVISSNLEIQEILHTLHVEEKYNKNQGYYQKMIDIIKRNDTKNLVLATIFIHTVGNFSVYVDRDTEEVLFVIERVNVNSEPVFYQ